VLHFLQKLTVTEIALLTNFIVTKNGAYSDTKS